MLRVQPATGLKHELVMYLRPSGNATCDICGSLSTALAPDSLLRDRKGWIWFLSLALERKRFHKKEGSGRCMGRVEDQATKLVKLPDRIAAIVGKTYTAAGDAFELGDDEALGFIQDLLDELDPTLIDRNKGKRLARHRNELAP